MLNGTPVVDTYGGPAWMDVSLRRQWYGERAVFTRRHLPAILTGGVDAIVQPVGGYERLEEVYAEAEESCGRLAIARTSTDVRALAHSGRVSWILCANEGSLEGRLDRLYVLQALGVRVLSLTHNRRNLISDGCGERTRAGLSHFGVDVVRRCGELGIIVDVSHISEAGFWNVMALRTGPVIATHSNARALCDHPRNLTDEQIRAIGERGGMVGINFYPGFVARADPTIEHILDHVEYIAGLVGPRSVGLGPDYINMAPEAVEAALAQADPTGEVYAGSHSYPRGAEDISSFSRVADGLARRGWSRADVSQIMGGSFLRVLDSSSGEHRS
jgi:membrane dipeptidase